MLSQDDVRAVVHWMNFDMPSFERWRQSLGRWPTYAEAAVEAMKHGYPAAGM